MSQAERMEIDARHESTLARTYQAHQESVVAKQMRRAKAKRSRRR